MSWEGESAQPDDRFRNGVPTIDAVVGEWERSVSEAMNTVRHALELAHERIEALNHEVGSLRARLDRIAAALNEPDQG